MPSTTSSAQPSLDASAGATPARPVIVQPDGGRHLRAFGQHLHVLLSSADTDGALAVFAGITPPGGGPPPHVHRRDTEVIVVLEGELDVRAGGPDAMADAGGWTRVAAGGAAFLPSGVPHTFRNPGTTPCRTLTIALPGGFEQFFAECTEVFAAAAGGPPDRGALGRVAGAYGIEFLVGGGGVGEAELNKRG